MLFTRPLSGRWRLLGTSPAADCTRLWNFELNIDRNPEGLEGLSSKVKKCSLGEGIVVFLSSAIVSTLCGLTLRLATKTVKLTETMAL